MCIRDSPQIVLADGTTVALEQLDDQDDPGISAALSGNLAEVVHQAAEMLGLEAKGKSLVDLAAECGRHVGV